MNDELIPGPNGVRATTTSQASDADIDGEDTSKLMKFRSSDSVAVALGHTSTLTSDELHGIRGNVLRLLHDEWPGLKNSSFLDTWRARDTHMRSIGPPMMLL